VAMHRYLSLVSDKVNRLGGYIGGACIIVISFICTYEVVMRYFFAAPTSWVLEISVYLSLASVFLAGGYVLNVKNSINVDLITVRLSPRNQILFQIVSLFVSLIFTLVLTWKGAEMAIFSFQSGEISPSILSVPTVFPYSLVPIGGLLLILELVRQIWDSFSDLAKLKATSPRKRGFGAEYLPVFVLVVFVLISAVLFRDKEAAPYGLVLLLFVLMFGGVSIAFALGMIGLFGFYFTFGGGPMLSQVPMVVYKFMDDFIMVAVPTFIMLSTVLSIGQVGANLFDLGSKWVRHLPGGLAVATIVSATLFAAMCGSSVATVVTIGLIAIPEMLSRGYNKHLVLGTVCIGGVLGPLIPPSIFMIMIGAITGDSVGKLFMAGMLPGIMLALTFSLYIVISSKLDRSSIKIEAASWAERWQSLKKSFFGLLTPVIILCGIYSGMFTPTEAASVGLVYSLIVCITLYRTIKLRNFSKVLLEGAKLSASILWVISGAVVFGQMVSLLQIPDKLFKFTSSLPLSPMSVLGLTLVVILILGALMDEGAILLITYPVLYYIFVKGYGFDSIWFAMVFVFTLEVGLVAPPVGINIFAVQSIWKEAKFEDVVKGVWPFVLLMVISILLVVYVKPLSLWLPRLMG
jgi:C4-dicarboxylate transporter, DctM subunit